MPKHLSTNTATFRWENTRSASAAHTEHGGSVDDVSPPVSMELAPTVSSGSVSRSGWSAFCAWLRSLA